MPRAIAVDNTTQYIIKMNGVSLSPQPTIQEWATNVPGYSIFDDNDPDYYPQLCGPNGMLNAEFSYDGYKVSEAYTGAHPVRKPRPTLLKNATQDGKVSTKDNAAAAKIRKVAKENKV